MHRSNSCRNDIVIRGTLVALVASALACGRPGGGSTAKSVTPPDSIPTAISVGGGPLVSGTFSGTMRRSYDVGAFRISRRPTTVAEYRACVASGGCSEPASRVVECTSPGPRDYIDRATYAEKAGDALPVTCTTIEQANDFCAWVGASLPTMTEWQLAARGTSPMPYAWGMAAPTCATHPATNATSNVTPCAEGIDVAVAFSAGGHPAGASASGMEDILLTHGELLGASVDAQFSACAPPHVGCVAHGSSPGNIEAFAPVATHSPENEEGTSGITAGFRCVWRGSK
jgi:hypothetical protein